MEVLDKIRWGVFFCLIGLLIFFSNFSVLPVDFMDEKRIIEAAFLFVGPALSILFYFNYQLGINSKIIFLSGAVFIILLWVSSILAPLPQWAFLQVGWYILLALLVLMFAHLYQQHSRRYIKFFIGGLFVLAGLYLGHVLAFTIISYFRENWPLWPNRARMSVIMNGQQLVPQGFLNFSNERFFNHIQTWTLPLLVLGTLYYKRRLIVGIRYVMYAIIAGWWMLVFASDARGTFIASFASLFFIIFLYRQKVKEIAKIYIFTALAGLVAYFLLFWLPRLGNGETLIRYSHAGRLRTWKYTLHQIAAHPYFGVGPMNFSYIKFNPPSSTPHDIILQSAVEWGIPAVVILAGLVIWAFIAFIHQKNPRPKRKTLIKIMLVASLSAGLIHSMVSGIFNTPFSQLLFCLILGWAVGYYFNQKNMRLFIKRRRLTARVWIIGLMLIGNLIFVSQKVGRDASILNKRKKEYLQTIKNKKLGRRIYYPRFWLQGKIGLEN